MKLTRSIDDQSIKFYRSGETNLIYVGYLEWKAPKYIPVRLHKDVIGSSIGFYINRSNDNVTLKFYI